MAKKPTQKKKAPAKPKAKRKRGRPNTYNFDLCKEICIKVADGQNIKTVLKSSERFPTFQTWCNWKRDNAELFDLYVKSIQDKSESVIEEIDQIMSELRDPKNMKMDAKTANVLIQTLKWKAAKFYPKMFGDKSSIDLTTLGESLNRPLTAEEIAEAKKKLEENY